MSITDFAMDKLPIPTTPEEAADLAIESMIVGSVGKKDVLKDKDIFNAIVLGRKISSAPFAPNQISAMFGTQIDTSDPANKFYGYRVRILDFNNPHSFYPIPCPINRATTYYSQVARGMHTLILATEDDKLEELDTCQIRLIKRGGKYDLSYGFFVSKTGKDKNYFKKIHADNPYLDDACSGTGELFNAKVRTLTSGEIGRGFELRPSSVVEKGNYKGFPIFGAQTPDNPFGLEPFGVASEDYEYVTLHITDGPTSKGAVQALGEGRNSYHYLIEPTGKVIRVLDPNIHTARHGGTNDSNSKSIGISLVNSYMKAVPGAINSTVGGKYKTPPRSEWYESDRSDSKGQLIQPFPKAQIQATISLIKYLKNNKEPNSKTSKLKYVTGHENVRGGRSDPGPAFDPYYDQLLAQTGLTAHPEYGIK